MSNTPRERLPSIIARLNSLTLSSNIEEPIQLPAVPEDSKVDVTQGVFSGALTRKSRKGKEKGTVSDSL